MLGCAKSFSNRMGVHIMKYLDLEAQYLSIQREINEAIFRVIQRGQFILGPEGESLEREIAAFCGVRHAVGLNSGTDALLLALHAHGIKKGDEVITTPFTFIATAETIAQCGAIPRFVDVDEHLNLDPRLVEAAISAETRAIIPVDLYGMPPDMDAINVIAQRHTLVVIEDAAQSIGAEYKGRRAGSLGDVACVSFFPAKNLGAYGDAGMLLTDNKDIADRVRLLRNHGAPRKYFHAMVGFSSRLDELQAAILLAKLPHLVGWNKKRQEIAERYTEGLRTASVVKRIPSVPPDRTCVYQQFTLRVDRRDELIRHLAGHGIPTAVHYPLPLHLQPAFADLGLLEGEYPNAEQASREVLSLPCYPELPLSNVDDIIDRIRSF